MSERRRCAPKSPGRIGRIQWSHSVRPSGRFQRITQKGKQTPDDAKLRALKTENKRLKMELEFLKKAAVYFVTHQK